MKPIHRELQRVFLLVVMLFGVTEVFGFSGRPTFTLNSSRFCVGDSWNLTVDLGIYSRGEIDLLGNSNGEGWEVRQWSGPTAGRFSIEAVGRHLLHFSTPEWGPADPISFEVLNCGPLWRNTASMNLARSGHTATLLANGQVLVTGAFLYPDGGSDSAELYDPVTETWRITARMSTARSASTATLLPNGKVLVVGGYEGSPLKPRLLSSAELYDPQTETWSATGSLHATRVAHTATLLPDGRVLVTAGDVGGERFDGQPTSELYDPGTGTWKIAASLPYSGHLYQTATVLSNGKVLLVGGIDNREAYPTKGGAALYDPSSGTWEITRSTSTPREIHTATLLPNGNLLVAGGTEDSMSPSELYDPETQIWRPTAPGVSAYTATLLPNGQVFFAGAGMYDSVTGNWSNAVRPGSIRYQGHTATLLPSGRVLLAGGGTNSAELYDHGFERPLLKLNSTSYCSDAPWNLAVMHAPPSSPVRLRGVSNGGFWEIAPWGVTNADGSFTSSGAMANGAEGTHRLHLEISGIWSNDVSFSVSSCRP